MPHRLPRSSRRRSPGFRRRSPGSGAGRRTSADGRRTDGFWVDGSATGRQTSADRWRTSADPRRTSAAGLGSPLDYCQRAATSPGKRVTRGFGTTRAGTPADRPRCAAACSTRLDARGGFGRVAERHGRGNAESLRSRQDASRTRRPTRKPSS
jgi:hypothetical protein